MLDELVSLCPTTFIRSGSSNCFKNFDVGNCAAALSHLCNLYLNSMLRLGRTFS